MSEDLLEKEERVKQLEEEVFRLQQENNHTALTRMSEGSALLQMEHLK